MHTIDIRHDGRHVVTTHPNGERSRAVFYNEATARHAAYAMKLRIGNEPQLTFAEFVDLWEEHYARVRFTDGTHACYMSLVRNYLVPAFRNVCISELSTEQVSSFIGELRRRGMRGRSITPIVMKLQAVLGVARKWGYVEQNPVSSIDAVFLSCEPANVPNPSQ